MAFRPYRHRLGGLLLGLSLAAAGGCESADEPRRPTAVEPPHRSVATIPAAPVQGKLRGETFTFGDARYEIDRRRGYEAVDIKLTAASAERPCGPLEPADAPRIWLRRQGAQPVSARELQISQGEPGPWELHYQIKREGLWRGSGDAAALVRLRPAEAGTTLRGELSVCFGDGHGSCVAGSFEARLCPIRLDLPVRGSEPVEQLPQDDAQPRRPEPAPAAPPSEGPTDAG